MHQLWQHPNGTYYVLYGPRLKKRVSTRQRDRRKAEAFLAQFIAGSAAPVVDDPTVKEILSGYESDAKGRVRGVDTLRFNVAALTARLGDLGPRQLLPAIIRTYARQRGTAPGTILREIGVLRAALAWAVENQWIAAAPIISNPVKAPKSRDRWLTRDEARKLIEACREPHIKAFVMLGLMTAARTSAMLEARWPQVDFERRLIDYGDGHGNKRRAIVPLNDELHRHLVALKELSCTGYLIEYHGRRILRIKKGFAAARIRAGLGKDVTPHVLRHSATTWMVMDGVDWREISRLTGDEEETLKRVYGHHSPDYLKRAANALKLEAAE